MTFVAVGFAFGIAEIHAGTAAGIDRLVFPLSAGAVAAARLELSPWPCVVVDGPAHGRVPMGIFRKSNQSPAAATVYDLFADSERERVDAPWRLAALPRDEFDAT